ncbi:SMP-30/gluconolactonase/LRE family protein [Streptomyces sp. NBC_01352]|uniref:SMP-30/gluconolactonase/LRE family protein n=1 Tax=unclassified Streptomyces TaxID=2593676 RepID=UPI002258D7D7|nr:MULTISPECIES: SMP-30/gluconolactonase/LRE family protein [unclassified Streptomyces]MCX4703252.1 SMP-30/gluconolactonase/LRE family protein [Streptomyces sp. NBC_01373]
MHSMETSTAVPTATLLNKRFRLAAAIAATAAVLVSTPSASASTATETSPKPVVTDVKTLATFDFTAGDSPENLTVNPDNSLTVSMLGSVAGKRPALVRIDPSGRSQVIVAGQPGDTFTGNTRDRDGTIYYNVASSDSARAGIWKLPPGGTPRRIAALPTDGLPNGLALDPAGRTLYAADSNKATVWSVPVSGGTATAWLTDPALAGDPSVPLGANGLRFHKGAVWVSNLAKGTLLRIPVTATGAPGRIHTVTSSLTGVDDFNFLNDRSDVVFAAQNGLNQVALVHPDGTTETVLTSKDGLASPTSTAVRGNRLYVTNAGLAEPHDAKVQRGTIDPAALNCGRTS